MKKVVHRARISEVTFSISVDEPELVEGTSIDVVEGAERVSEAIQLSVAAVPANLEEEELDQTDPWR